MTKDIKIDKKRNASKSTYYALGHFLFETKKGALISIVIGATGLITTMFSDYQDSKFKKIPFILFIYFIIGGIGKFFLMDILGGKEPKKPKLWVKILDWVVTIWSWISIICIIFLLCYIPYIIFKLRSVCVTPYH